MSYCTLDDVIIRFPPVKTMIGTNSNDVTSTQINSVYIAQNESLIDAYLAARYVTPMTVVAPLITMICADLSIHALLAEKSSEIPEWMDKRRDRSIDLLEQLRDGLLLLPSSVSVTGSLDSYAYSPGMDAHPIFSPVLDELQMGPSSTRMNTELAARGYPGVNSC